MFRLPGPCRHSQSSFQLSQQINVSAVSQLQPITCEPDCGIHRLSLNDRPPNVFYFLTFRATVLANGARVGAAEISGPVCLPSTVVIGEGLLPAGMVMVEFVPGVADLYRPALVVVLGVKITAIPFKATHDGYRVQLAGKAAHPIRICIGMPSPVLLSALHDRACLLADQPLV
jgi:hypothetical protein